MILLLAHTPMQLMNAIILSKTEFAHKKCDLYYTENLMAQVEKMKNENVFHTMCLIDLNLKKAGSKNVLELHGSVLRNYCMKCGKFYDAEFILHSDGIPRCECGGMIKPDVVLYEEGLDGDVITGAVNAIANADTLIIGGTSLVVYPAAGLVRYFRGKHLVVINKGETGADEDAELVIDAPIGQVLGQL